MLKRIWNALWMGAKLPCPLWLAFCLLFTVSAGAVTPLVVASVKVPTSGTITDPNATASSLTAYNASKQLNSASVSSPLAFSSNTLACGTCLTTAGTQTITGPETFGSTVQFNAGTAFLAEIQALGTAGSCTGQPATVYGVCLGSGNGTTNNIAQIVGKQSGGFGGTTASDSAKTCLVSNDGAVDNSTCNYFTSGRTYIVGVAGPVGSGPSVTQISGATIVANGPLEAADPSSGTKGFVPRSYTTAGAITGNTLHGVFGSLSTTTSGSCAANAVCGLTTSLVTLTGSAVFSSGTSYSCSASYTTLLGQLAVFAQPDGASTVNIYAYNISGSTITTGSSVAFTFYCVGT